MNIRQTLLMAFKSITNNKLRSFLTMLGIIIGVGSVIALVSITQAQTNITIAQMFANGANRIDMSIPYDTTSKQREQIEAFCKTALGKDLSAFSPSSQSSMTLKYRGKSMDSTQTFFGNEQYGECIASSLSAGRTFSVAEVENGARVCIIGEAVRKQFFGALSPVGQNIRIGDPWLQNYQTYKVVGVYDGKYKGQLNTPDQMVLVPYTHQLRLTGWENNQNYVMAAKDADSSISFSEALTTYGNKIYPIDPNMGWSQFSVQSNQQSQEQLQGFANQSSIMMGGIAGISLLVGGIGIMNIMLVTVTERTREIGIRMAIGARRRDIIGQFLVESASVSACGGIVGIIAGYFVAQTLGSALLAPIMNQPGMIDVDISVGPNLPIVIGAFIFSVLLGIVFGLYPANKASKMQPVDALRTQ